MRPSSMEGGVALERALTQNAKERALTQNAKRCPCTDLCAIFNYISPIFSLSITARYGLYLFYLVAGK